MSTPHAMHLPVVAALVGAKAPTLSRRRRHRVGHPRRQDRRRANTPDDDLTVDHMRLLQGLDAHPTGSLAAAAQALGMVITMSRCSVLTS